MYNTYNPQLERINNQIAELERIRSNIPMQQPTNLTQNFQLAPNREPMRYANSIDEVQKELVTGETPYFDKNMSVVWIKNSKGEIKTYELKEIIPKDDKDIKIEYLEAQIEELKKEIKHESNTNTYEPIAEPIKSEKPTGFTTIRTIKKKQWESTRDTE